ncbi:MAG: hypothetical protein R2854_16150 [Caldilineaceae bacterium]
MTYTDLRVTGTTRWLVAFVTGLAAHQEDEVVEKRGPSLDVSSRRQADQGGRGSPAGQEDVADLGKSATAIYAVKRGRPPHTGGSARFPHAVHGRAALAQNHALERGPIWATSPPRWIVALYGDHVAALYLGRCDQRQREPCLPLLPTRRRSFPVGATTFAVPSATGYFDAVAAQGVMLTGPRKAAVAHLVQDGYVRVDGYSPDDPDLLDVTGRIEALPACCSGTSKNAISTCPWPCSSAS